ncbi:hypothetical protein Syn7803C97_23 [Synechococcus phage S-MbCM6]|uniref:Uncharacterized protein n=1 Tax=Synechococcus phage S-MbCM6 TaxID=3126011 RepID=A0A0E3F841_9CAUD|nr:hypothetical protein Syn7803C97_23 [Synechococcus phage ACG-2014c]
MWLCVARKNKTAYDEVSYWEMVMGMFDTIHCNYDLGAGFLNRDLQTKDLEGCCEYWLDPAGKLWQIDYSGTQDFEDATCRNTVSNGNRGKIRPCYITKEMEVYPASWDSHYAPFPRQTITFVEGQLCMNP